MKTKYYKPQQFTDFNNIPLLKKLSTFKYYNTKHKENKMHYLILMFTLLSLKSSITIRSTYHFQTLKYKCGSPLQCNHVLTYHVYIGISLVYFRTLIGQPLKSISILVSTNILVCITFNELYLYIKNFVIKG